MLWTLAIATIAGSAIAWASFRLGQLWEADKHGEDALANALGHAPGAGSEPEEIARAVQADWPDTPASAFAPPRVEHLPNGATRITNRMRDIEEQRWMRLHPDGKATRLPPDEEARLIGELWPIDRKLDR